MACLDHMQGLHSCWLDAVDALLGLPAADAERYF